MALAPFDAHWLAEAVRLREARAGRLDDAALLPALRAEHDGFEPRALARAEALAGRLGWREALDQWHGHARLTALLLAALASSSGAALAYATLGDPGRPVNLVWALLGLLGMHLLSLALWLAGLLAGRGTTGAALGRLWLGLVRRVPVARKIPELGQALARLLAHDHLARWLFGMLSHGLWALLLCSALLTLLALFSLRRYGFVWETTILPPGALGTLIGLLDLAPRLVGLGAPDPATLDALPADGVRAAWARWLLACVALYGLLPRVLLWAWCRQRWHAAERGLHLDTRLPDVLLLRQHLTPDHGGARIADPAPASIGNAHLAQPSLSASAGGALLGVELGPDLAWPPPLARPLKMLQRIETRADRQRALDRLAADPPRRLLVAFDARLSPDRGSYALLAQLAAHAGSTAACLLHPASAVDEARLQHWREGLEDVGLPAALVLTDLAAATLWLEHADE